jgi:copper transport protein
VKRLALLIAVFVTLPAAPATAHAVLESTEPGFNRVLESSPPEVLLRYSEPVEITFGAVRVFDAEGRRVDTGEARRVAADEIAVGLEPDLPDGTYTVAWRVLSADSHPLQGGFVFHVGAPGARAEGIVSEILPSDEGGVPSWLAAAQRWLSFASLLVLTGSAGFGILVWARRGPRGEPAEVFASRWRRLLVAAWAGLVVSTAAGIVIQGARATGTGLGDAFSGEVLSGVAGTRFGTVYLLRLGLLAALAFLWPVIRRHGVWLPRWAAAVGGIGIAALLATPGIAGHAGVAKPVMLNVVADAVHLEGVALWIGGLVTLLFLAFPATRRASDRVDLLAPVVSGYSRLATAAVATLVVAGVYRGWVEVGSVDGLLDTSFGAVLLVKLGVFITVLALGALSNRHVRKSINAVTDNADRGAALSRIKRLVSIEVAVASVIVGVTAVLVSLPPGRTEAQAAVFTTSIPLGAANLEVLVDPAEVGENFVHLTATRLSGKPLDIDDVEARFSMAAQDIGPIETDGRKLAPGHFVVQGRQLSLPGTWIIEVVAVVDEVTEERARIEVEVED